jgi:hypothetical protein
LEALVPILVRPVREQLEHDRIIRLLEAKWRRKFKVDANPGDERNVGVKVPAGTLFPDLILTEEGGRKPKALVEVETNESVNHLEAMAQWANLAKSRTSLILFVPVGAVEAAKRLAGESSIKLAEVWTYLVLGDQVRFTSVFREDGAEPADLIEKVEVFTTERSAPAPRPVPVEPAEPVAPPVTEPERPRKLAVKAGSRPAAIDAVAPKAGAKVALKAGAKVAAPEPPPAAPVKGAAPAKAAAQKPDAVKPAAPAVVAKPVAPTKPAAAVKPIAVAKPVVATKPVAVAKPAPPAKTAPPVKVVAPAKVAAPVKPVSAAKPAAPVKAVAPKPAEKPKPAVAAAKPADKGGKKPVPAAKPEPKKVVAKAAPAKPVAAKKPVAKVPPPRPALKKAAPVRPAASAKKAAAKPGSPKRK